MGCYKTLSKNIFTWLSVFLKKFTNTVTKL